jgi:NAD(P)-dependent dehydrogenase (short-subunit alcohol dehydrogenase family)
MSAGWKVAGRVALVTGANRGIGRALVDALLERGARKIYAGARKPETLAEIAAANGGRIIPLRLDITETDHVRDAAAQASDVDLLVNNAAVLGRLFAGFDDAGWIDAARGEFETNVLGALRLSQAFAPVLARNGGGTLVNVSSIAGLVGMPPVLTYSSSKAALHSLTQSTRAMLRGQGTYVAGVYPGPVDTDMASDFTLDKVSPASVAQAILDGLEGGLEEIYPDPMAVEFGGAYAVNPKDLEARIAALVPAD